MSNHLKDFHHYKGDDLSPSEKVERKVVEILLNTDVKDEDRDSSIVWELKHSSGCCQIARILAQKRGLDIVIAEVASLLHDIYIIVEGKGKDHAVKGAPIARQILEETGGFSEDQIKRIVFAISEHSKKDDYSNDPYVELVKDVDVLDCSLYKGAENYYLLNRPKVYEHYKRRIENVRKELGLTHGDIFRK